MGNSDRWQTMIWERRDLSSSEKLVALAIAEHANHEGTCFPGRKRLAAFTELTPKTVSKLIPSLAKKSVLIVEETGKGPGNNAGFRLLEKETSVPLCDTQKETSEDTKREHSRPRKGTLTTTKGNIDDLTLYNHDLTSNEPIKREPKTESRSSANDKKITEICDEGWLKSLSQNLAYQLIDISIEYSKAEIWTATNHREMNRRFFVNWLNKAKPIDHQNDARRYPARETSADRLREQAKIASKVGQFEPQSEPKITEADYSCSKCGKDVCSGGPLCDMRAKGATESEIADYVNQKAAEMIGNR